LCEIRKHFYSSPFEKCFEALRNKKECEKVGYKVRSDEWVWVVPEDE